ncbi:MAG: SEC-C metal-binding domain-containing protein [Planctomycetota bacterium]|nr:SEC-C metal-binding domain-containing protein [Planctomycetota bacterium]
MPTREIRLETAAFLDSTQFKALSAPSREEVRKIVDAFLSCAYDEVGIAPRLLDGEHMHGIVGHLLPGHFGRKDPLAAHALPVLRAYVDFLSENAVVTQLFEMRRALESTADEFEEVVRTGEHAHHAPRKPEKPFVHRASKVGRNDPCPCGSGRKLKACCAKLGT